jgi:cytochrome P450
VIQDPIPYYRALHERGPVVREPHKGVFMLLTDRRDPRALHDHQRFSAIVGPLGPLVDVPRPDPGESWAEVIERRRPEMPLGDQLMSMDPPKHTRHRSLAGRLFTPNRLKQNEDFILTLADQLIDEFADRGEVEFSHAYARPFTLLVIADLLGVPREDHKTFPRLARRPGWHGRRPPRPASRRSGVRQPGAPTSPATSSSAALRRATTS